MRGDSDWRQGKNVLPMQVVRDWKRLSIGGIPSLRVFKPWLDEVVISLV